MTQFLFVFEDEDIFVKLFLDACGLCREFELIRILCVCVCVCVCSPSPQSDGELRAAEIAAGNAAQVAPRTGREPAPAGGLQPHAGARDERPQARTPRPLQDTRLAPNVSFNRLSV